jgi:hypothetical protein
MAVDYIIDQSCKVKEALSLNGLVSLIKQRERATVIIEMAKKNGKSDEEALNMTFKVQVRTPGGVQETDVKVSELLAGTKKLDELQPLCKDCTAGFGRPFGCYRSLHYPISRKAEEWLADVARKAAESRGPAMLPLQFIVEKNVDGGNITRMRADPGSVFFELKRPLDIPVVVGTGLFNRKTVNTDQVFNQVIGLSRMRGAHMKMLLLMSGALAITDGEPAPETYNGAFQASGNDGVKRWWAYRLKTGADDDSSARELKEYFKMMFMALALQKDMIVSI